MWTRNKNNAGESASRFSNRSARRGAAILTALCAAISLYSGAVRASNPTYSIYLYNSNGTPVNVTSQYLYQEPHVFDRYGNPIGTVDSANYIDNASNQHIGYITALE